MLLLLVVTVVVVIVVLGGRMIKVPKSSNEKHRPHRSILVSGV